MQTKEGPDDLTPREREVFGLLRLGLTNEEIAERLGISLDGAKYHVSQILSKLGVGSREEAAAVPVEARRRWWVMLPLAAKAAGVAIVVAAVGGLGLLAYGVVLTSDGDADADQTSGEEAESRLPRMVLQPEDVPPNMDRFDGGFQDAEAITGQISSYRGYRVAYQPGSDEPNATGIACIRSSVTLYGKEEDASQALDVLSEFGTQLGEGIVLPSIGDEASGYAVTRPEATSCGSYEQYIVFRRFNTLSSVSVWFLRNGGDVEQSVEYARRQAKRVDDVLGGAPLPVGNLPVVEGPRIGDHWHAPYTFFACGEKQPNARVWESGVNTHGDGIIHISPFQTFEEGSGASLVKWFQYGGGRLTETEINIPGSDKTFRNGDLCPGGEPGELQVFATHAGESAEQRLEGDALLQYIPHDGDRIRIVFGPPEEPVTGPSGDSTLPITPRPTAGGSTGSVVAVDTFTDENNFHPFVADLSLAVEEGDVQWILDHTRKEHRCGDLNMMGAPSECTSASPDALAQGILIGFMNSDEAGLNSVEHYADQLRNFVANAESAAADAYGRGSLRVYSFGLFAANPAGERIEVMATSITHSPPSPITFAEPRRLLVVFHTSYDGQQWTIDSVSFGGGPGDLALFLDPNGAGAEVETVRPFWHFWYLWDR